MARSKNTKLPYPFTKSKAEERAERAEKRATIAEMNRSRPEKMRLEIEKRQKQEEAKRARDAEAQRGGAAGPSEQEAHLPPDDTPDPDPPPAPASAAPVSPAPMDLDSSAGLHVDTTHGASGSGVGTQEDQENDAANEAEDMSSEDLDRLVDDPNDLDYEYESPPPERDRLYYALAGDGDDSPLSPLHASSNRNNDSRSSSNQSAQPEQEEIDSDDMPPGRSAGNRQPGQALSRRLMPARRDASPGSVRIPSSQNLSANSRRPANRGASRAAANRSGLAEGRVGHDPQGPAWPGAATPRVNRTPSRQPEDRNSRQPRFSPLDRGPDHRRDRSRSPRRTPRPIRTRESYHLANPPETYGRNFAINLGTSRDVHVHYHFHGRYGRPSGEHNHRRGR